MEAVKTLEELLLEQLADQAAAERAKRTVGTPEAVERLQAEMAQTLSWWRTVAEEKKYTIGHLEQKPESSEELAMLVLHDKRLLKNSLGECGGLFSDGSIYWTCKDGSKILFDHKYLLEQWAVIVERMADAIAAARTSSVQIDYPGATP